MKTIGIDPGTKNLALCMTDGQKIIQWNVINIFPDPSGIASGLTTINFEDWVKESTDVVIERQPSRNPRVVRIQICIEMFCAMNGGRVYCIDPKHKLSYASSTPFWPDREITKWTYYERKKLSVETVANFLKATEQDEKFVTMFEKSKKKDDLADSLLHCLAFDNNIRPTMVTDRRKPVRNIKAVKPSTANAKSKKYTQGNLKFLAKSWLSSFDIFKKNGEKTDGFTESCCRHFNNLDNSYLQLGGKL